MFAGFQADEEIIPEPTIETPGSTETIPPSTGTPAPRTNAPTGRSTRVVEVPVTGLTVKEQITIGACISAGILAVMGLAVLVWCCYRKKQRKKKNEQRAQYMRTTEMTTRPATAAGLSSRRVGNVGPLSTKKTLQVKESVKVVKEYVGV